MDEAPMSRHPPVILALCVCGPLSLGAQSLGIGYQIARSNQIDRREANGPSVRLRFPGRARIELRYDYLGSDGRRFDTPCGGFILPNCGPEPIEYSSNLHNLFIAVRASLLSR